FGMKIRRLADDSEHQLTCKRRRTAQKGDKQGILIRKVTDDVAGQFLNAGIDTVGGHVRCFGHTDDYSISNGLRLWSILKSSEHGRECSMQKKTDSIEVKNLTKTFGSVTALN